MEAIAYNKKNSVTRELSVINYSRTNEKSVNWSKRIEENKRKREAEIRKNYVRMTVIALFICLTLVLLSSFVSKAASDDQTTYFKYYSTVMIKSGDTLDEIASAYADQTHYSSKEEYINEIVSINHLEDSDMIKAGNYIVIPYYSNEFKK